MSYDFTVDTDKNEFWRYSLAVYQLPEVQRLCLHLQEQIDADVNLILFAGWLAKNNIDFSPDRVNQANKKIKQWRKEIIKPLRDVRYSVKKIFFAEKEVFYERIKVLEVAAEFESQKELYKLSSQWQIEKEVVSVYNNLGCYLATLEKNSMQLKDKKSVNDLSGLLHEENKKFSI